MKGLSTFVASALALLASTSAVPLNEAVEFNNHLDYNLTSSGIFNFFGKCWKGYTLTDQKDTPTGFIAMLKFMEPCKNEKEYHSYGDNIKELKFEVYEETSEQIHIKITDPNTERWEIPNEIMPRKTFYRKAAQPKYQIKYTNSNKKDATFGFQVIRKENKEVIFDSQNIDLVYKDQFIQFGTTLPKNHRLYGVGEESRLNFKMSPGKRYALWALDKPAAEFDVNTYSSHPFYVDIRGNGLTNGVYVMNSNGMDVIHEKDSIKYRIIGGVIDLYIFMGPTVKDVINQYTTLIGKPAMMPYWSFGLHNCRWGYDSLDYLKEVTNGYLDAKIPIDTFWSDIDYMDTYKVFTLGDKFPQKEMKAWIDGLHESGHRWVPIVDPGIKIEEGSEMYIEGLEKELFIKGLDGKPMMGQVWPGATYFPDWFHPEIDSWWEKHIQKFHDMAPADGLWIDMNEIASFCNLDGLSQSCYKPEENCPVSDGTMTDFTICCLVCSTIEPENKLDIPPYKINNADGPLGAKTLPMSSYHINGFTEYNVHNLHGLMESISTYKALINVRKNQRPFIVSRSTAPGSGQYVAHWTGDNRASWDDLKVSIVSAMTSGLWGIPMVGSDICGFFDDTTPELCTRWIQTGAFHPFSRVHNGLEYAPQELYRWDSVAAVARKVYGLRYAMLPYMYTVMHEASVSGVPIIRPLLMEFPNDESAYDVELQFMLGNSVMVSPITDGGKTEIDVYFPAGKWYDLFNYSETINCMPRGGRGCSQRIHTPLEETNVHIHGGNIIPLRETSLNTVESRTKNFELLVALDQNMNAEGNLFHDDGEQVDLTHITTVDYTAKIDNNYKELKLTAKVTKNDYNENNNQDENFGYSTATLLGVSQEPTELKLNNKSLDAEKFSYDDGKLVVSLDGIKVYNAFDLSILF